MNRFTLTVVLIVIAVASQGRADTADLATCGTMKILDQCHITWNFSSRADSYYSVQQFDPLTVSWRTIAALPQSVSSQGTLMTPVEAGYLYRVLACDDSDATTNCSGSTMVWAPLVQPESQIHLIPSRVPMAKWEAAAGMPLYATVDKKNGWLGQVIQYNVYQMLNAIARANVAEMPDMTPVKDMRLEPPSDAVDQVQFNVYWAYSAERGAPIDSPLQPPEKRPPHEHPERHPQ
jgi:hypothetical protein